MERSYVVMRIAHQILRASSDFFGGSKNYVYLLLKFMFVGFVDDGSAATSRLRQSIGLGGFCAKVLNFNNHIKSLLMESLKGNVVSVFCTV